MISLGWKKVENENGYPYYVNEPTNERQWDHPKFSDLRQRIDECNYVRYSTYRVALKFRVLQHALHMDDVPLTIISGVFERHRLGNNESSLTLESCDLEAVLSDIYFAANKKNHMNIDVDFATDLMLNFLYNVYDRNREGKIQVASTKVILGILSNCTLFELYKFFFNLCADHNNCVTRLRLQAALLRAVEVTAFLHEDVCFGAHLVNSSVENCFSNSAGLVGISESAFISWLENGPQILSWIPLLHRIKTAEPVVHTMKCNSCKTSPIMGLRYRCMKCVKYTQCQRCFLTGRLSHNHKLSHSMKEYCSDQDRSQPNSYNFIKYICGLFCPNQMQDSSVSLIETKPLSTEKADFLKPTESTEILSDIKPLSSAQTQLQIVIRQLEMQNKELQQILQTPGSNGDKDLFRYLEEHRILIAGQIQKLKILKDCLECPQNATKTETKQRHGMESTPMVQTGPNAANNGHRNLGLDLFSPIANIPEHRHNVDGTYPLQNIPEVSHYTNNGKSIDETDSVMYGVEDISSWIGGHPNIKPDCHQNVSQNHSKKPPVKEIQNDLDEALAKLQQILANNFCLDESIGFDNTNLKHAVSEVEGMLTSIIDTVESSRSSSVVPQRLKVDNDVELGAIRRC